MCVVVMSSHDGTLLCSVSPEHNEGVKLVRH